MLPPVLEIYVVSHPGDNKGLGIAENFFEHFHGTPFTGLIGEAAEVFIRSEGWNATDDAPRPIPSEEAPLPNGVEQALFVAIVPLMGTEMAAACESSSSAWLSYIETMVRLHEELPNRIGIFPCLIDAGASDGTNLGGLLERYQRIAATPPDADGETEATLRCRDLAQGIAQLLSTDGAMRLTVFISHTKRHRPYEEENTDALIAMVREVIASTRLQEFFDASDLQPGGDWESELRSNAATSALLAIRTDLYPSREWCQREFLIAKRQGMPIVTMDANSEGEERGSFLMDHVPRIPVRMQEGQWIKQDVYRALNLLVGESLKRALWVHQEGLSRDRPELNVAWWAPHAPEPLTFVQWLEDAENTGSLPPLGSDVRILHPDPPLGEEEKRVMQQMAALKQECGNLDIMTPRLLAARGG